MIPIAAPKRVMIAGFEIDLARAELRTTQGAYVELRPRSFAVLRLLAEHLGQMVSKRDLLARVWDDAAVTDDALTQCIADIRRTIGDREHRVLRTVPRRGYMLLGAHPGPASSDAPPGLPTLQPCPEMPPTRYARSGECHIAYQVSGDGPLDIVFVQGYVTHLEIEPEDPRPANFLRRLATLGRLIRFDKRGVGLSDRVAGLATLEERMDDVRAVMDAVGSERAVLLACSEGGPMSMLFAATYPERVRCLILCGTMARIAWAPDHPWGRTEAQLAANLHVIEEKWGSGHSVDIFAPSYAADPAYRAWRARLDRAGASPGAAMALARMNFEIDVRHVLPSITAPTLVIHRAGDVAVSVEHSRHLAPLIPGARYLELPGPDHTPWAPDSEQLCEAIRTFIHEARDGAAESDRVLTTILIVESAPEAGAPDRAAAVRRQVALHRGCEREAAEGRWIATFDGPARAVRCGRTILAALAAEGVSARAGVHTGECEMRGGEVQGIALRVGTHVVGAASWGEVLVTSTVRDLVAGSGLRFDPRGEHSFADIPGIWFVLATV